MQLCVMAGSLQAASVTLAWDPSPSPAVAGYFVYYGPADGIFTQKLNAGTNTVFVVPGLVAGSTYYFSASCFDKAGREGSLAPEISYTIPSLAISNSLVTSPLIYGQSLGASIIEGTVTNSNGGVVPGTFAYASPTAILSAGTHTEPVVFTPADTVHFNQITGNATVTVNPASLTLTAKNAVKTYGQAVAFAGTEFAAAGLVNGDTLTTVSLSSPGTAITAPVGNYAILLGSLWSGNAKPANYRVTLVNGTLTVNRASLTVTANNSNRAYGAATPILTATYTGFVNGDTTAVISGVPAFSVSAISNSPVGSYPISVAIGSLKATNYGFVTVAGTLRVTPASLTITANAASKTYGQALTFSGTEFTAAGLKNGETVGTVTLVTAGENSVAPAGFYQLYPQAAAGGTFRAANYAITYNYNQLVVNPAPLTITAKNGSKTYGQALGFAGTEFAVAGLVNGETVTGVTLSSPGAINVASVGTYAIVPGPSWSGTAKTSNYTALWVNGSLVVNRASIVVTAVNASRGYGAPNPPLTPSYSGLVNGDTAFVISGAPTLNVSATSNSPVGNYPITVATGTLKAANYGFVNGGGTLSVTPAALTITANALTKIYGQTINFAGTEFTAAGLQNSEKVGTVTLVTSGANALAAAGFYQLYPQAATGGTFQASNYAITYNWNELVVNPAPVTITANNESKILGRSLVFAGTEFSAVGLVNGDTMTNVSLFSLGAISLAPAGAYAIVPGPIWGGTANPANYTATWVAGRLTVTSGTSDLAKGKHSLITPANPPLTINPPEMLRNGNIQLTFAGSLSGEKYDLQVSRDLQHWSTLTNEMADGNGLPAYIDVGAPNGIPRFFRMMKTGD